MRDVCGVNFAVPLPPSPVMDNSTMRDGQPRKASAYFSQRFYEKFWLILIPDLVVSFFEMHICIAK